MRQLIFSDISLLEFGNDILISGVVYSGKGKNLVCLLPNEANLHDEFCLLDLNLDEWKDIIKQTDLMETEILQRDTDGHFIKAIVRKTTRQIEQAVSWRVYKRDGYACRYCGRDDVPLTVDHIVLWEKGGPSIDENLISSCRKCNKTRGNLDYKDWLLDKYYMKVSNNLTPDGRKKNIMVLDTIDKIPVRVQQRSR